MSTSLVDDEGVDLVFHRRGSTATLAVQVKARMSDSKRIQSEGFVAFVRDTLGEPNSRGRYRFNASVKQGSNDRWRPYRLEAQELPPAVIHRLEQMEGT